MDDEGKLLIEALEAEAIRKYLARGRRLGELSDKVLCDGWLIAYRKWSETLDPAPDQAEEDFHAEILLRGLEFPFSPEAERIRAKLIARGKPNLDDISSDGIKMLDEIGELLRARKRNN